RRPAELSGGERQRVALGRALVREPQVFLLDEPLSNLEPTLRGELRADLLELHRALDTTVVYVTHDQIEAMTMGQRMAVLEGGRRCAASSRSVRVRSSEWTRAAQRSWRECTASRTSDLAIAWV